MSNVEVDDEGESVSIIVNPRLYKVHIIMRAADSLLHEEEQSVEAIIDGDPEDKIKVKFIPKKGEWSKERLLKLAYRFNTLLVSGSGKG